MGSDRGNLNERPARESSVNGFWMDAHEVTNSQFADFVSATGYITLVEQKPKASDFPGVPEGKLVAGAMVFHAPDGPVALGDYRQWWRYTPGASWRHPEGPGTSIRGKEKHPVVDVAYQDAAAFCAWAGKRLPTESEWEFAADDEVDHSVHVRTAASRHHRRPLANIWQGHFPDRNTEEDGYSGTAPVASFPSNGYGLYDMEGNVWEWTTDRYQSTADSLPSNLDENGLPFLPTPQERVIKGGSFLCNDSYCSGFRPSARMAAEEEAGQCHVGFRCVEASAPTGRAAVSTFPELTRRDRPHAQGNSAGPHTGKHRNSRGKKS